MTTYKEIEKRAINELICGLCMECNKRLNICKCTRLCADEGETLQERADRTNPYILRKEGEGNE